jgi:hypothetical protein
VLVVAVLFGAVLPVVLAAPASAALLDVGYTLEGCRLEAGTFDQPTITCSDAGYTTGNLGKLWSELDLVPMRITLDNKTSATAKSGSFVVAGDHRFETGTAVGWDFISPLTLNPAKSSASCPAVTSGPTVITPSGGGAGGIDQSIYKTITASNIPAGATCVYDLYMRLALGSHLFSGSSLQANLFNETLGSQGIGEKRISINTKEINPQVLTKDMVATRGTDHIWTLQKGATPARVDFTDTCGVAGDRQANVSVTISWEKGPATPTGAVTVNVKVYATNPASRSIDVKVEDVVREGATVGAGTVLDSFTTAFDTVPANTANFLVLDRTFDVTTAATTLNNVATGTYRDTVTGLSIPQTTEATDTADVNLSGPEQNKTATITDSESISGSGFTFSVATPSVGSFTGGYVAGTAVTGPVGWTSGSQSASGSVTFNKTIYVAKGTVSSGALSDTATLAGSDGATASANASIDISSNATAVLTIQKTLTNNVLEGRETATFGFVVKNAGGTEVATRSLIFGAGDTTKSTTVNLPPGQYTVEENAPPGWSPSQPIPVDMRGDLCAGRAEFTNSYDARATAKVTKITKPSGFESGWTFNLKGPGVDENGTTGASGVVEFATQLGEGNYTITETTQAGWSSDGGVGCTFTVNLPADADKQFSCEFTNTYQPTVTIAKRGADLSKGGDSVDYYFDVTNTSPTPVGPAGAPNLECQVTDTKIGYTSATFQLAAGASTTLGPVPFTIPMANYNDDTFDNTATVKCTYPGGSVVKATNTGTHSTNLFQPSLTVVKSGPTNAVVGDEITYTVKITNTSSADSPVLLVKTINDLLVGPITLGPTDECYQLDTDEECTLTYKYTVPADAPTPLKNAVRVVYNPKDFTNEIKGSDVHNVNILKPAFTVTKVCKAQPVSQDGPAVFTVTITNTGNADLVFTTDETGTTTYPVAAGASTSFDVTVQGPFSAASVSNTIKVTGTLATKYTGVTWTGTKEASGSCEVAGRVKVVKTVRGLPPSGTQSFTFQIRSGATPTELGTVLESKTANAANGGMISFTTDLVPGQTYQLCEIVMPGWSTSLGTYGTVFVPDADDPNVDNSVNCVDFTVTAGQVKTFTVDNTPPPGGQAHTIGFWKNWTSCDGKGKQAPVLDQTLYKSEPNGITIGTLTLHGGATKNSSPDCAKAVNILNKTTIDGAKKKASDPLFNMAAQLLAAKLNIVAGAATCPAADTAIASAQALLVKYNWNGLTYSPKLTTADANLANTLNATLDKYNNNNLC